MIDRKPAMQRSYSDLEYAAKKKVTRRGRVLGEIDAVTPWPALLAEVESFYLKKQFSKIVPRLLVPAS